MMNPYLTSELNRERQRELAARAARRALLRRVEPAGSRRPSRMLTWLAWRPAGVRTRPAAASPADVVTLAERSCCAEPLAS